MVGIPCLLRTLAVAELSQTWVHLAVTGTSFTTLTLYIHQVLLPGNHPLFLLHHPLGPDPLSPLSLPFPLPPKPLDTTLLGPFLSLVALDLYLFLLVTPSLAACLPLTRRACISQRLTDRSFRCAGHRKSSKSCALRRRYRPNHPPTSGRSHVGPGPS